MNNEELGQWVGRREQRSDIAAAGPLEGLAATLDHEQTAYASGQDVPPLWHWSYFLPRPRQSALGSDGHPLKGGFLPPIELPRRMWAGSELEFHRPLKVGSAIHRVSSITDVTSKDGRTGPLVFVTLMHEISDELGRAVSERQNLVYRNAPEPGALAVAPIAAPVDSSWRQLVQPSPELLFRYSALTFNTHRIHYDRPYAVDIEGYGGLVVHGPLVATLLLDVLHKHLPGVRVSKFNFKAVRPLIDTESFVVSGKVDGEGQIQIWASDMRGALATIASAQID